MGFDVDPLLHNKEPVTPVAVSTELVQLLVTSTTGAITDDVNGAAVPLPGVLVQPLTD